MCATNLRQLRLSLGRIMFPHHQRPLLCSHNTHTPNAIHAWTATGMLCGLMPVCLISKRTICLWRAHTRAHTCTTQHTHTTHTRTPHTHTHTHTTHTHTHTTHTHTHPHTHTHTHCRFNIHTSEGTAIKFHISGYLLSYSICTVRACTSNIAHY